MNILILGAGGREHALAWKIKQSKLCGQLYVAPGNAGTAQCAVNVDMGVNDFDLIMAFCKEKAIGMLVVGPEEPLVNGIYDICKSNSALLKMIIVAPSAAGAQLEGSKAFSKHFMQRHNIPTAGYAEFDEYSFEKGLDYLQQHTLPIVLKADGLAAGKGVVICNNHEEACGVFTSMIKGKQFGEASSKVVVEEFLQGIEVSVFVLTDGNDYKIIGHAKDYKRIGEGETGPNTGGMGCVTPVPFVNDIFIAKVEEEIIKPTIKGIRQEGLTYHGFLFIGLMNMNGEPFVIEYNCRMGDPETEVVIPRLKNDLVDLFVKMHSGNLDKIEIEFDEKTYCTIVAVSGGYPGNYKKGETITGLDNEMDNDGTIVFHAGTLQAGKEVVTNGGRVLAVTASGKNMADAVERSKKALTHIHFEGMNFRNDIGFEFL